MVQKNNLMGERFDQNNTYKGNNMVHKNNLMKERFDQNSKYMGKKKKLIDRPVIDMVTNIYIRSHRVICVIDISSVAAVDISTFISPVTAIDL